MSTVLKKQLTALPDDEQDAIARRIISWIEDENEWKRRFAEKGDVIARMAREALDEDPRGETQPFYP
jgi:hypothetical protein